MPAQPKKDPWLTLAIQGFTGLSLKLDWANRPNTSWQQLDNVDLYVPGSLRKVLPAVPYGGPYGANILNCIEYLAQPNGPSGGIRRLIGVGADGKLYDLASATPNVPYLDTSALLGIPPTIPYLLQQSGFFVPYNISVWIEGVPYAQWDAVLAYSPADGNLYVFYVSVPGTSGTNIPTWPNSGSVVDGGVTWVNGGIPNSSRFLANYLCIYVTGKQPVRVVEWQYNPADGGEAPKLTQGQMGVSAPKMPVQINGEVITPNLNGYAPSAGRAYLWTFYNPQTLQESSPSPFIGYTRIIEADNGFATVTINGSILPPLPPSVQSTKFSSYQTYYIAIPISALTPPIGQGYTAIRIYATKDGQGTFFLVNTLYGNAGNQISNSNGAVPIAVLKALSIVNSWTDYFPVPGTSQSAQPSARVYEGSGAINLAPDPQNLSPEAWTINRITNNPIFVASGNAPDGSNSFEYDGDSASSGGPWQVYSTTIKVLPSTQYYFQGYIDNSAGTGGKASWRITNSSGGVLAEFQQADSTAGIVNGTYTTGGGIHNLQLRVYLSGVTVTTGSSTLWSDPVLEVGAVLNPVGTNYPTTDDSLFQPAPAVDMNGPPPVTAMAEVCYDAVHMVDYTDQTKIWYTQQGLYELVGANSFVRTTVTKNADQILELIKCFDRLLVEKGRSIEQITTYPPQEPVAVDPQHGVRAKRASITWGSSILGLLTDGVGQVKLVASLIEDNLNVGMASELFGDDIKPLIDSINAQTLWSINDGPMLPCPTIFNDSDLYMLAYQVGSNFNDNVLMYYLGRSRGFTRLTAMPNNQGIITLKEIQTPSGGTGAWPLAGNGDKAMMALTTDARAYILFAGTQDGSITATAVTQPLPTPGDVDPKIFNTRKTFDSLWIEGEDLANWRIAYATGPTFFDATGQVAAYNWQNARIVNNTVRIGVTDVQIVFKFTHATSCAAGITPMLTKLILFYSIEGEPV